MKRLIYLIFPALISTAYVPVPCSIPWNEEKADSLGPVSTAHSTGGFHSSIHYDLTRLLALKMGLSADTAELLARYCALVDQINPKAGYPYPIALNSISIPDTFPTWDESLAGTERGGMNSNVQNELTAQYWHFPFRDPNDSLTGAMTWGNYPVTNDFTTYTGSPYFWRVPITYNLKHIMNWALYNGGSAGLPDMLTPTEVYYANALSNGYQLVQPNSIQAFGIFLHSLGDSYSHEECMVHDTLRSHPVNDPYCGLTYHSEHEFAYDVSMRAKKHADSMFHALWRSLREFKRVHGLINPAVWTIDNNGFQDWDGIPDELEDDGDTNAQESFLERWKNPANVDLNDDGVINHSDHTTWRIQVCNNEMAILPQPGLIAGPQTVCEGSVVSYSIEQVAGASGYYWVVPSSWSGQSDSTTLTVTVGNGNAVIGVFATGPGGNSPSRQLSVNVIAVPEQISLSNINILFNQTVCSHAQQTIEVAGESGAYIVRNGGSSTLIAGHNIFFHPGTKVISGGYLLGYITSQECCIPEPSVSQQYTTQKQWKETNRPSQVQNEYHHLKIYPNPTSGVFRILIDSGENPMIGSVEVFDQYGVNKIRITDMSGEIPEISLAGHKPGVYFIKITCRGEVITSKVVLY